MNNFQYVLNRMPIKLTNLVEARSLAKFYSQTGITIYVLRERDSEYYRPSVRPPEFGDGFDTVDFYEDGKVFCGELV